VNFVFFLLGNSAEPKFYVPTFRKTLSVSSSDVVCLQTYEEERVFRNVGT